MTDSPIRPAAGGVRLLVKVRPRSAEEGVLGVRAGRIAVAVTAAPEKDRANKAVIRLLAKKLRVSNSSVEIVSGRASREKTVRVGGVTVDTARSMLGL